MGELIHGWKDLMAYTGLTFHRLERHARLGHFRIFPRRRTIRSRVSFHRSEIDRWYVREYETSPPGADTDS